MPPSRRPRPCTKFPPAFPTLDPVLLNHLFNPFPFIPLTPSPTPPITYYETLTTISNKTSTYTHTLQPTNLHNHHTYGIIHGDEHWWDALLKVKRGRGVFVMVEDVLVVVVRYRGGLVVCGVWGESGWSVRWFGGDSTDVEKGGWLGVRVKEGRGWIVDCKGKKAGRELGWKVGMVGGVKEAEKGLWRISVCTTSGPGTGGKRKRGVDEGVLLEDVCCEGDCVSVGDKEVEMGEQKRRKKDASCGESGECCDKDTTENSCRGEVGRCSKGVTEDSSGACGKEPRQASDAAGDVTESSNEGRSYSSRCSSAKC